MKISVIVALVALIGLAGCTKTVDEMNYSERKALAGEIVQRCVAQGVKPGTAEMQQCTGIEAQSEIARRRRQAAVEDARRSSDTSAVCTNFGNTVICN